MPIEELAGDAQFDEVAYLLLYGELPKTDELTAFRQRLAHNAAVPHCRDRLLCERSPPTRRSWM